MGTLVEADVPCQSRGSGEMGRPYQGTEMIRKLVIGLWIAMTIVGMGPATKAQVVERPNILIIVTDDQRANAYETMPKMLSIFRDQGTKYTNAIATTPWCCPSRASIMSGQYVHNHGVTNLDNSVNLNTGNTLTADLRAAG